MPGVQVGALLRGGLGVKEARSARGLHHLSRSGAASLGRPGSDCGGRPFDTDRLVGSAPVTAQLVGFVPGALTAGLGACRPVGEGSPRGSGRTLRAGVRTQAAAWPRSTPGPPLKTKKADVGGPTPAPYDRQV